MVVIQFSVERNVSFSKLIYISFSRKPSLQDFQYLPFTEAFILEVMRRATAVPLGTPHVATEYIAFYFFIFKIKLKNDF